MSHVQLAAACMASVTCSKFRCMHGGNEGGWVGYGRLVAAMCFTGVCKHGGTWQAERGIL